MERQLLGDINEGCRGTPENVRRLRDVLRDRRNPLMAICWLRFFLRFDDEVVWTLLQDFGTQEGINTDDLEQLR